MAGLLDFFGTPQGIGLLSGVASYAANARRGTPINNIGRGLVGGLAGYGAANQELVDAERRKSEQAYRDVMMQAQMMNAQTAAENARRKRKETEGNAKSDASIFQNVFGVPVQVVDNGGDDFDFMPAGYQSDMIEIKDAKDVKPQPQFQINENMAKMYGFAPEDLNYISGLYQVDPRAAIKEMSAIRAASRKGRTEAKDVLAKEKALADAMGMPLGQYLKYKADKPGQQINVHNYAQPKEVTLPDGTQALVRFPEKQDGPAIVTPYAPKASDTDQMAAGYASRMSEAGRIIDEVGAKGFPTEWTAVAGSLPGNLGRYTQSRAMTAAQQKHRQAQEDWVRAKLRKESGAVIADEEMEREISTYFPKPGDSKEVIEQKAASRRTAEKAMIKAAGPAAGGKQTRPSQSVSNSGLSPDEQKELEELRKRFGK